MGTPQNPAWQPPAGYQQQPFQQPQQFQQPMQPQPGQPPSNVNATAVRNDVMEWPDGDLPSQGGRRETLMPGVDTFRLPLNLAQLWSEKPYKDNRQYLPQGQNPTFGQLVIRQVLKLDRNSPLVGVGGHADGVPLTATLTTNPRPRGKKDDPKTPWIHEIAFMLEMALQDKSRPRDAATLMATVNRYAGHIVRVKHGLKGHCNPDKVRYIAIAIPPPPGSPANTPPHYQYVQDPSGMKGCDENFYTEDYKADDGTYDEQVQCKCGAVVRGFESVDEWLPPLASTQQVAGGAQAGVLSQPQPGYPPPLPPGAQRV